MDFKRHNQLGLSSFGRLKIFLTLFAGCSFCCVAGLASEPTYVLVDGTQQPGQFAGIDPQGRLLFSTSAGQQAVSLDKLAWWGECGEVRKGCVALLADGSVIRGDVDSADGANLTIDSELLGDLKLPWNTLAGIVFHTPASTADRDRLFDRIMRPYDPGGIENDKATDDRLILQSGDEITGHVEAINAMSVRIKGRLGTVDIPIAKALALVTKSKHRANVQTAGLCWIGLTDGSRLLAGELHAQGESLAWKDSLGQPRKVDRGEVRFLMPLASRVKYLSDLTPSEYHFLPFLDIQWPYRVDRNVTGGLLRAGERLHLKGLGVHSAARLTYSLGGNYREFLADIAIDDSTGGSGSVGFRVFVDGKLKFTSGPVRGGMVPLPVRVSVSGSRRLDLIVDYGEAGDVLDHADWLDARLLR
jgi:hypothetical protein